MCYLVQRKSSFASRIRTYPRLSCEALFSLKRGNPRCKPSSFLDSKEGAISRAGSSIGTQDSFYLDHGQPVVID